MAKAWQPPEGRIFASGRVGAIITWQKSDNKEVFRPHIKRDAWETVLPELVFAKSKSTESTEPRSNNAPPEEWDAQRVAPCVDQHLPTLSSTVAQPEQNTPDPNAIGPELTALRESIRKAVTTTETWRDLVDTLETQKIALLPKGGGLAVKYGETEEQTCKLSALGFL